ncbi:MAG TPA: ATP-binding cassette domain-containing protein [Hyphomicrobiaceae bacterium]|nr:ATP-binding cassette domain-containing protein [Hyphomicrobiaceae bacterium]
MLEVGDLHAGYGGREIVCGATFVAHAGETITVLGANGAGKSTLLGAIAGLVPVTRGRIVIAGRDVAGRPSWEAHDLGIVLLLQAGQVFTSMTVGENLQLARTAAWRSSRFDGLQPLVDLLRPLESRRAGLLSGGERQLLAIALALLQQPRCILLDEPSANLFPAVARHISEIIQAYVQATGSCVVLVEQNARFALDLATRVFRMFAGRLSEVTLPKDHDLDDVWRLTFGEWVAGANDERAPHPSQEEAE